MGELLLRRRIACSQDVSEQNTPSYIFMDYRRSLFQIEEEVSNDWRYDGARSELVDVHGRLKLELVLEQDGWGGVHQQHGHLGQPGQPQRWTGQPCPLSQVFLAPSGALYVDVPLLPVQHVGNYLIYH